MYKYKLSVIMSVYNVEPYMHEAIDCVINQDIGLENIQIILVNDGSRDNSGAICDEYAAKYPDNVVVIHKENGGLSSARNAGVKVAEGEYLSFFDPDDILDSNTFSKVYNFFKKHDDEIDVVAIPIVMFGSQTGEHPLNVKFKKGTRVIDLEKEWMFPQLSVATAFLRTETARKYAFDQDLDMPAGEDCHELVRILPHKNKLGVVSDVWYHYRKRGDSLIGHSQQKKSWYTQNLKDLPVFAIDFCNKHFGHVPKFIQFTLMYDLQWKLLQGDTAREVLDEQEYEEYRDILFGLFKHFDDDVIMGQRNILTEHKSLALAKKYGSLPQMLRWKQDVLHRFGDYGCFAASELAVHVPMARLYPDRLTLEGWCPQYFFLDSDIPQLIAVARGVEYPCEMIPLTQHRKSAGEVVYRRVGFRVDVPMDAQGRPSTVRLFRKTPYGQVLLTNIILDSYFPISQKYRNAYYSHNGWVLMHSPDKNAFLVKRAGRTGLRCELKFLKEVWDKNLVGGRKAVRARVLYRLLKPFVRKRIWLITDKANRADDNGEAFFKYCCEKGDKDILPIFLIGKDSPDYERLKKIGTVLPYMSWQHKFAYLFAEKIISAYSHIELNNPFYDYVAAYQDMMQNCKFVFLQHGVIHTDVSNVLNRMTKNIQGFVTSAAREQQSITDLYGYDEDQVWLTGLPRHDFLYHDERKSIVVMPTWRRDLFGAYHAEDSRYDLKPGFEQSDFYQFMHNLLTDERLRAVADKHGYSIEFVPHPVFFPYVDRFQLPDNVKVYDETAVYRDIFARNKLLVTDYSSVAFDFAYLRKPVIYSQFSALNHYERGYFDYERDGFGEVVYNLEDTVNRLIEYIENDCRLKDEYRNRIDRFFAFDDRDCCKRVYDKIMQMED